MVTPAKYECDSKYVKFIIQGLKYPHRRKNLNGALVTPTLEVQVMTTRKTCHIVCIVIPTPFDVRNSMPWRWCWHNLGTIKTAANYVKCNKSHQAPFRLNYSDVIMSVMAYQITGVSLLFTQLFFRRRSHVNTFPISDHLWGNILASNEFFSQSARNMERFHFFVVRLNKILSKKLSCHELDE